MKYLKHILLFAGLLGMTSCSDFLEEYSQDTYYVTSYEDLDELLTGDCYLPVQQSSTSSSNYAYFFHFLADELEEQNSYYLAWGGSSSSSSLKENVFGYYTWQQRVGQNDSYTGFLTENATWTETYRLINVANNIIASVETVPQNSEDEILGALKVKGEAHFLRAAYYFWLANLYGKPYNPATAATDLAVPIKIEEKVNDIKYSRNTVQEVYDQVLADLSIAEECLSQTDAARNIYEADIVAVNLLQSRVYLYMQNWSKASEYADAVLEANGTLINLNSREPYDGFLSKNSEEVIFSMGGNDLPCHMNYDYQSFRVSHDLYDAYEEDDLRKSQWWWTRNTFIGYTKIVHGSGTTGGLDPEEDDNYYNVEYNSGWYLQKSPVSDKFLYRTAEAYLNKAEACAYLGDEDEARSWLNALRQKRFTTGSDYEVTATGEELVDFIREERRRELALEGFRWFDLRRYGVCEYYPESEQLVHRYTYYESSTSTSMVETHVFTLEPNDAAYTLPIPQEVLDYNTGMENNERPWRDYTVTTPED